MNPKRDITIDDLFRLKLLNTPEISPDGQKIVFSYRWTDLKNNTYYSNLYMADLSTNAVSPFTRGDQQDTSPVWSPDGKSILFRSDRQKKKGVWVIPSAGGEAYPLITDKGAIGEYLYSPDGKFVAYTFRKNDEPVPIAHLSNDPSYVRKEEDENPYDIIENIPFKSKGGTIYPKGKFHIYLLEIATGEKTQWTDSLYSDSGLCFSPDGKTLAFFSNRAQDPLHNHDNSDIYLLDLSTKGLRKLETDWGIKSGLSWSSDQKYLYYTGRLAPKGKGGAEDFQLYKVSVDGGKSILLSRNFKGYVSNMLIGDSREFEDIIQPPLAVDDEKNLIFCASYKGGCYLYKVPGEGGNPTRVEEGEHEIAYYSMDRKAENIAILKGDILQTAELFHYRKEGNAWKSRQITFYNQYILDETNVTRPEEIHFTTSEGIAVQGWLLKPPHFDATQKYPLVHQIHGGPHVLYGYTFFHEMQYMASKGYCVLFINPRGSRGYGADFTRPVEGNWGGPDYRDQMEFLDHVISLGYIDEKRLFLTGGSYGGYMTNWIVTQNNRYRAAVSHRSVSNLISSFGVSCGSVFFEEGFGGVPWRDYEHYIKHSPLFHAEKVETPILLMQSENDHLTPTGEAEQFFTALRYLNKKVRFVRFKNETHELSRGGKPTNRRARLEIVMDWFETYRQ